MGIRPFLARAFNAEETEKVENLIQVDYSNPKDDKCGPEEPLVAYTLEVKKSELIGEAGNKKAVDVNPDLNYKIVTLKGTSIVLGVLDEANKPVKDIIYNKDKVSYKYAPKEGDNFQGVLDPNLKTISNQDGKIVGRDVREYIISENSRIHLIYEKVDPEKIDPISTKFTTKYYYVEMPEELLSQFYTDKSFSDSRLTEELDKYYKGLENDINEYYGNRNKISNELVDLISDYVKFAMKDNQDNQETKDKIIQDLKDFKVNLSNVKAIELTKAPIEKIDNLISILNDGSELPGEEVEEEITKKVVEDEIKKLKKTLVEYLREDKKYTLKHIDYDNVSKENQREVLIDWYDQGGLDKTKDYILDLVDRPVSKTHYYKGHRHIEYSKKPISISEKITPKGKITKDFIKIEDYDKNFELNRVEKWMGKLENDDWDKSDPANVKAGFEINDEVPVIYVERIYDTYKLVEKNIDPPTPEKTKKDLHIVYRFYNKEGTLRKEYDPIEYNNLPSYINRLGWIIDDFTPNGFKYWDKEGLGLKEKDVKYSAKLENNKTVILYLDYKGEGDLPPINNDKYDYSVFYQEVKKDNPNELVKQISYFKSQTKYPKGTKVQIKPLNLEGQGYRLLDKQNQETNKYEVTEITIENNIENPGANNYYYKYVKDENLEDQHVYKVEYMDKNANELAASKMVYTPDKKDIKEQVVEYAKSISNYKARIGSIRLSLDKIELRDIHVLEEELKAQGYSVVIKGKTITISKGNVEAARIYIDSNKLNTVRFIYNQDEDDNKPVPPTPDKVTPSIPDKVKPKDPKGVEHIDYVEGYPDGSVKPLNDITRAEVSAIIYRIMDESRRSKIYSMKYDYNDTSYKWSREYIASLTNGNIVEGYPDGSFRPNGPITRGEVAAMISRYNKVTKGKNKFQDVKGHWSEDVVGAVLENGWIQGYPDGSYRPDQPITRAELVTIINRMLDRGIKKEDIEKDKIIKFTDLKGDEWYYADMVEATNGHDFKKKVETNKVRENEHWTYIKYYNEHMYGRNLKKKTK